MLANPGGGLTCIEIRYIFTLFPCNAYASVGISRGRASLRNITINKINKVARLLELCKYTNILNTAQGKVYLSGLSPVCFESVAQKQVRTWLGQQLEARQSTRVGLAARPPSVGTAQSRAPQVKTYGKRSRKSDTIPRVASSSCYARWTALFAFRTSYFAQ